MEPSQDARRLIEETSRAMQLGPAGESTILALFADDAEWVEPYTGQRRTHSGKGAIRAALRQMWTQPSPPGFAITTDRMDVEGQSVKVEWTCSCDGIPQLMRGYSLYSISPENLISRLELFITDPSGGSAS